MLAEAVVIAAEKKLISLPRGVISPSIVSPCPYRTYKNWKAEREPPNGVELLRMNDGHYQEQEMVDDLVRAGFQVKWRNKTIHIGEVMEGHIDGIILVSNRWHLLECKAMSLSRYTSFKQKGFGAEPGIKSQVQPYLASDELQGERISSGYVYSKHKDTCRPFDLYFEYEPSYVNSIIEQVVQLQGGWIPTPEKCPLCSTCRLKLECWGATIIDFSKVHTASLPELVEQWKKGRMFRLYGKELQGEAREVFLGELGDKDLLFIDDLRVQKIFRTTTGISMDKFVEKYGTEALASVLETVKTPQVRITEIEL